jgi:hypothetical protein
MAYARIDYHPHARRQMRQRRVSERQVAAAIQNPDRVLPGHSGRLIAERTSELGNVLRVIYEEWHGGTVAYIRTVYRIGGETP